MQKSWSVLFAVVNLGAVLLFVVAPFYGWWLPRDVSSFGGSIDLLFYAILAVTGFFFVLTEALLVYAMYKFAAVPGRKAAYVHGNHKLELVWTLIPAGILVLLGVVQIQTWANIKYQKNMPAPDKNTQQVEVIARQWEWRMRYPSPERYDSWVTGADNPYNFGPNAYQSDVHVVNELHVWRRAKEDKEPQKVLIHLRTRDVLHSLKLVNLRLMQDAVPGKVIPMWLEVEDKDDQVNYNTVQRRGRWVDGVNPARLNDPKPDPDYVWEIACAEYCGTRHSMMKGKLFVHKDKTDFMAWLRWAKEQQDRRTAEEK